MVNFCKKVKLGVNQENEKSTVRSDSRKSAPSPSNYYSLGVARSQSGRCATTQDSVQTLTPMNVRFSFPQPNSSHSCCLKRDFADTFSDAFGTIGYILELIGWMIWSELTKVFEGLDSEREAFPILENPHHCSFLRPLPHHNCHPTLRR